MIFLYQVIICFVLLFVLISSYDMQTEVGRCNFMDAKLHRTSGSEIRQVTHIHRAKLHNL